LVKGFKVRPPPSSPFFILVLKKLRRWFQGDGTLANVEGEEVDFDKMVGKGGGLGCEFTHPPHSNF
jgi:hypothetical protein